VNGLEIHDLYKGHLIEREILAVVVVASSFFTSGDFSLKIVNKIENQPTL
jgi:hypothetical protein